MNFRTNQVLQFYVNNEKNTVALQQDATSFWFTNTQDGKVVSRTDIVDKDKVLYITAATAESMQIPTKGYTVTVGEIEAGQDYIVKVNFTNYQGMGDEDTTVRVGYAHAKGSSTAATIAAEIADILKKNIGDEGLIGVEVEDNVIYIGELLQNEWILGVTPNEGVNFTVTVAPVIVDGEETFDWATIAPVETGEYIANGRKMADLEYFAMGERGDQYRMVGWPNIIRTNYLVDPNEEYDAITIHFAFVDANDSVQKSERDLMIVGPTGSLATLLTNINNAAGTTVEF